MSGSKNQKKNNKKTKKEREPSFATVVAPRRSAARKRPQNTNPHQDRECLCVSDVLRLGLVIGPGQSVHGVYVLVTGVRSDTLFLFSDML